MFSEISNKIWLSYISLTDLLKLPVLLMPFLLIFIVFYIDLKSKIKYKNRNIHQKIRIACGILGLIITTIFLLLECLGIISFRE